MQRLLHRLHRRVYRLSGLQRLRQHLYRRVQRVLRCGLQYRL